MPISISCKGAGAGRRFQSQIADSESGPRRRCGRRSRVAKWTVLLLPPVAPRDLQIASVERFAVRIEAQMRRIGPFEESAIGLQGTSGKADAGALFETRVEGEAE